MIYVALLRGVNVGGKNRVKMTTLATGLHQAGLSDVTTYINSGNVIFRYPKDSNEKIEKLIERVIEQIFDLKIKLVVQDINKIEQIVNSIPDSWAHDSTKKCNVIFLHSSIDNPNITQKLVIKPEIEELHYCPGALFWAAKTSDLTKSNMIKLSQHQMYQNMTVRNLNTTQKIYQIMSDLAKK